MSSPNHNESISPNGGGGGAQDEKPRLTEEEKKQNHIASGQCDASRSGHREGSCVRC